MANADLISITGTEEAQVGIEKEVRYSYENTGKVAEVLITALTGTATARTLRYGFSDDSTDTVDANNAALVHCDADHKNVYVKLRNTLNPASPGLKIKVHTGAGDSNHSTTIHFTRGWPAYRALLVMSAHNSAANPLHVGLVPGASGFHSVHMVDDTEYAGAIGTVIEFWRAPVWNDFTGTAGNIVAQSTNYELTDGFKSQLYRDNWNASHSNKVLPKNIEFTISADGTHFNSDVNLSYIVGIKVLIMIRWLRSGYPIPEELIYLPDVIWSGRRTLGNDETQLALAGDTAYARTSLFCDKLIKTQGS